MKLQVLNLAVKLFLTNPEQTQLLSQYVFSLARYDDNYDVRDRTRFLKPFIFPTNGPTILSQNAKKIFLAQKPAPLLESKYKGREQFQLGSLSHYLNVRANGYHDLPPFPKNAPDSSVRGVENVVEATETETNEYSELSAWANKKASNKASKTDKSFYSDSENEGSGTSDSESDSSSSSDSDSSGETESADSDSDKSASGESSSDKDSESSDSESDSSSSSGESSSSSSEDETPVKNVKNSIGKTKPKVVGQPAPPKQRSNLDLLLDLDDIAPSGAIMTPSLGGLLTPMTNTSMAQPPKPNNSRFDLVGPSFISFKKQELLNKINGHGLQISYRFIRAPHLYSAKMVSIELTFHNDSNNDLENIHLSDKSALPTGVTLHDFASITKLGPGQSAQSILGIDFNDSAQPLTFAIASDAGKSKVTLKSTVGELIRAISINEAVFKEKQAKLRGMNEHNTSFARSFDAATMQKQIFELANVGLIAANKTDDKNAILFAGQTMSSQSLVLVSIEHNHSDDKILITVNCEKMVVGSMLLNELKNSITTC